MSASTERRRFLRVKKKFPFNFNIRGESKVFDSETYDISLGGVGFFSPLPLKVKQIIHMRMKIPGYSETMSIRGLVRWVKQSGDGRLFVGIEFFNIEQDERDLILQALREG